MRDRTTTMDCTCAHCINHVCIIVFHHERGIGCSDPKCVHNRVEIDWRGELQ